MTDEQMYLVNNLLNNREKYLNMVPFEKKSELSQQYKEMSEAYRQAYSDAVDTMLAINGVYASHKVDPYIAGGLAQGAAGIGAGIAMAGAASIHNAQVEADRFAYQEQLVNAKSSLSFSEQRTLEHANGIMNILESVPEIKELRNRELTAKYETAVEQSKSFWHRKRLLEAKESFKDIASYKDSAKLAKKCENNAILSRQIIIFVLALLTGYYLTVVGGFMGWHFLSGFYGLFHPTFYLTRIFTTPIAGLFVACFIVMLAVFEWLFAFFDPTKKAKDKKK